MWGEFIMISIDEINAWKFHRFAMTAEEWIAQEMEITERIDPRTENIRPIDMRKECDLAYIRMKYKRARFSGAMPKAEQFFVLMDGKPTRHSAYNISSAFAGLNTAIAYAHKDDNGKTFSLVDDLGNILIEVKGEI